MTDQTDDARSMARLQAGDRNAIEDLYDRYTPLMLGVALRILRHQADAEDAIQDAWLQVWRRRGSFDAKRGNVGGWLVTIARTRALDRYRSLASRGRTETEVEAPRPDAESLPEANAQASRLRAQLGGALETLDPKHRQVLEIAYFEGLSQSEIASRLEVPLGTVKYWMRQGLLALRDLVPRDE